MSKMPHTSFYKGSKIRIILRSGDMVIAKFIEKVGKKTVRTDKGDFKVEDLRSCNYYKPLPHEMPKPLD
jgi:hypothetical protein